MIKVIPKIDKCWWCGKTADSREHRHKKTDIIEVFGRDIKGKAQILKGNKEIDVQGPNSKLLKFDKVLCHQCNTEKSQPFDHAYDIFIKKIQIDSEYFVVNQKIDFEKIFPENTLENKLFVIKYYIKHICCRLASNNISIKKEIIDFLNGYGALNYIYIKFEIRMDLIAWIERLKKTTKSDIGNLYIGPLRYFTKADDDNIIDIVYSFYTYRWFRMAYFYSEKITEKDYPGFNSYNTNIVTPASALYIIHPDKYDTLTEEELLDELNKSKKDNDSEMLDNYLGINPF